MTEAEINDSTGQDTEEIRTASDLRLEELTKRLDALEAENLELREANKGLWAAAHPAPSMMQQPESQVDDRSVSDKAVEVLYTKLGVI